MIILHFCHAAAPCNVTTDYSLVCHVF